MAVALETEAPVYVRTRREGTDDVPLGRSLKVDESPYCGRQSDARASLIADQFESYRHLGEEIAREVFADGIPRT